MRYFVYYKTPNTGVLSRDRVFDLDDNCHCPEEAAQEMWEILRKKFPTLVQNIDIYVSTYPIARSGRPVTIYNFHNGEMSLGKQETDGCDCHILTSMNMHWILLTNHHENCPNATLEIRTDEAAMKMAGLLHLLASAKVQIPAPERALVRTCLTIAMRVLPKVEYRALDGYINQQV